MRDWSSPDPKSVSAVGMQRHSEHKTEKVRVLEGLTGTGHNGKLRLPEFCTENGLCVFCFDGQAFWHSWARTPSLVKEMI